MRNSPPKYFCALLFCLLFSAVAFGQLSKKHYVPPLTYSEFGNARPQDQYVYISTPNNLEVTYTITPIGQPASSIITGTVTRNNPDEIFLDDGPGQLFQPSPESSTVVNNRGYIIEAEDVIYVSVRMRAGNNAQAGALVSKGIAGLGTVFRAGSYTNENPQDNYLNFFSFMATEDNTTVVIDNLPTGIEIRNYTGTFPITVNLNEGESYVVATNSNTNTVNRDGLIGTLIESDKPIVVNSGSANGSFHNGNGRDYGMDQIVDVSNVGNEYIFIRGDGSDNFENILIVAHEDNTDISINGSAVITSINAGEYYLIEGDQFNANGNMYVNTSKNVFAYQGVGGNGNSEPNQGMFFVPPLSCNNRGDLNSIANIQNIGSREYNGGITIVTNKGSTVEINGQPIANYTPAGPFDVDGNPDYVTYKILGLTDNVSVLSTGELYCAYFNFNGVATSGSFYSGFPSPPEIDFNLDITAAGNCIPNITLEAFNIDVFDAVEWYYDDGSGYVGTGITTASFKPSLPGGYKLVGIIACSGLTLDSPSVRVSVCPDDFDGDGVIDNMDIDIDNDGVSNCDESLGNVLLNLSSAENPVLNFQDGSVSTDFASGILTTHSGSGNTTDFSGETNGDFSSTLGSAITADLEYRMDFQDDVNFLFREKTGYAHTSVTGETFTIIIGPSEQNITLLDPDNRILVDTDFDGIFEAGIDNFSTSEIRFIYNPTPNGSQPFQFVASKIDYVIFKHRLSNTTEQSSFEGHFGLTCFKRDSDNDGNEDAFDLDNDNDGIPDLLEATGSIITLTNSDSNFDGLDNVFGVNTINPADTDSDGIPDFLDLDSDNDGIFDLFEAGHNQPDTNLDGIIDNSQTNSGINGLFDLLETNPDSFVLNYNVANTDNDTLLNATELDSDNDLCFDVIEAGFTDDDGDGLLSQSSVQVGTNGLVLNAADGYTIPDSNYIDYAPIVLNSPFTDVTLCEGDIATMFIDTTADILQWQITTNGTDWTDLTNNGNYTGTTTNTLTINNLPIGFDGYQFRVLLERTGNSCGEISNTITLNVSPLPEINTDVMLSQCDDNSDGIATFNLFDALPLLSNNYTNETFDFYMSESDAINNTNPIGGIDSFTTSIPTNQTLWVRVTSTSNCYEITSLELHVSTTTIPSGFLRTFSTCDDYLDLNGNDTANNNDRDGITTFDFSSTTADILSLFPASQQLSVRYYPTENDAITEQNEITNPDSYRNINYLNTQQIFVRIDDVATGSCSHIGPYVQLRVNPVPQINPASNIQICDPDGDGFVTGFDLESRTAQLLAGQNPTHFSVSYHLTEEDARNNVNVIPNATDYDNIVPYEQTIYVRMVNHLTGCFTGGRAFYLQAVQIPNLSPIADVEFCDDNSDGIAQNIDLDARIPEILANLNPAIHQVTFYESLGDAELGINALSSPYSNTTPFSQRIYIRVENTITRCYNTATSFDIIVHPEPELQTITNPEFCDDDTDGIVSTIDLDAYIPQLLGSLNPDIHEITFHTAALEAETGDNPISSPFTNTNPDQQTMYVRVVNTATGCINFDSLFQVIILPQPIVNTPNNLELCDDDDDGIVGGFNLESQTSIALGSLDPTVYPVSYHLTQDDADSGSNPISNTTAFENTIPNQQTIYIRVENLNTNCINSSLSFDLIVNPLPEISSPTNLTVCDDDTDGLVQDIDLDSRISEILGNLDPSIHQVTFYESLADAELGINALSSPYSNTTPFLQTIYIRVENTVTDCYNTATSFDIIVHPEPELQTIINPEFCDDDADGIVATIDLDTYIPQLLGSLNPDIHEVTFHITALDAETGDNPIGSPFTNTNPNQQTIYVRVVNTATGCINFDSLLQVIILPQPVVNTPNNLELCDDNDDGIVGGFNLESQTSIVLGSLNPTVYPVSYHLTQDDADSGSNPISNTTNFENTIPNQQTIYIRVENLNTSCINSSLSFDLIVNPLPEISSPTNLTVCDDDTDGLVQNIDLDSRISEILGNLDPSIHQVTFYESLADFELGINALSSPYSNSIPFSQRIYIRVENTITHCYNTATSFDIIVHPEPELQTITNPEFCDDDADGIVATIDLDTYIPQLLGSLNPDIHEVTFHTSALDSETGDNPISSPFTNTNPDQQTMYVRVVNTATGCINFDSLFQVIILPQPIVNTPNNLELCDDDDDGIFDGFNLESQTSTILGSLDPTTHLVSYHLTQEDADSGSNPISNTTDFENTIPNQQTIYIRVENLNTSCINSSLFFNLIVNPLPEVTAPNDLIACDDGAVDGSMTNGLAHNIDLDQLIDDILGTQNPIDFSVTFHTSVDEAQSGSNAIVSPFTNTVAFSQTIYIRVENLETSCIDTSATFSIIVNPAPTINPTSDIELCDNDDDGDDENGFVQNIYFDTQIAEILGSNQSLADFEVTFHESLDDAELGNNALTAPYSNTMANNQLIYIRITNRATGCSNFARGFHIVINSPPQFDVMTPQFICVGEDGLELRVENPQNTYDYFWIDADGNTVFGETLTVTSGGIYSVTATKVDGSNCSKTKEIVVAQSSIATITEEDIIIDDGDDDNSITINDNPGALGTGDYEFALLDSNGNFAYEYQDEGFFGNLRGGIYTILVRDKNGCGVAELEVPVLEIPRFFTPNNDGVNDFWNLKGITSEFIEYFPSSKISVFNRFGKFIADFTINEPGWNGRYNGVVVISNDYWVKVELIDRNGKTRVETRNFALLRR